MEALWSMGLEAVRSIPLIGYDIACGRCTPALPKATPAHAAARAIVSRASPSPSKDGTKLSEIN